METYEGENMSDKKIDNMGESQSAEIVVNENKKQLEVPKVEEPKMEEPKVEALKAEEPKLEESQVPVEVAPVEQTQSEEPKAEPVVEEPKAEEPKVEEDKVEELKKEEVIVTEKESLKEEIKQTKEELAVIKEVRDELVALYAQYSDLKTKNDFNGKEMEQLKATNESLVADLKRYRDAEEKLNAQRKQERLERLSAKFKLLGQEKSVEQLSEKDDKTVEELEAIVDAAVAKVGDTRPMPEVTISSQAVEQKFEPVAEVKTEVKSDVVVERKPVKHSQSEFFKGVLKDLAKEQAGYHTPNRAKMF